MTKLSQELNSSEYSNPIYVTSVPDIQHATVNHSISSSSGYPQGQQGLNTSVVTASATTTTPGSGGVYLNSTSNGHCDSILQHQGASQQQQHDQELELKQEILPLPERTSYSSSSSTTTPTFGSVVAAKTPAAPPPPQFADETADTTISSTSPPSATTPSSEHHHQILPTTTTSARTSSVKRTHSQHKSQPMELGSHREMAVDVPESFVGTTKTPPRYPPPKPAADSSLPRKKPERTSIYANLPPTSSPVREPPPIKPHRNGVPLPKTQEPQQRVITNGQAPSLQDLTARQQPTTASLKDDQLERIRKYQDELRKRRAEEERQAREEEFLRSSLRGSKKLQALESHPPPHGRTLGGIDNTGFDLEEGDSASTLPLIGGLSSALAASYGVPELQRIAGASELLESLLRLEAHLRGSADLSSVEELIRQPNFQKVLSIHNKVQELWCFSCPPVPLVDFASQLSQDVISLLQDAMSPEATELLDILSKYEVEGLLCCHDRVAERQVAPPMTPDEELLDRASHYTEESVKIVRIDKTHEPLGATVRNEGESVIIGRIVKGGAAEKSGLLHEGDEILEVNGIEMRCKSVNDVCDILANMTGTLTFLVVPAQQESSKIPAKESVMHVRALFDYDPDEDMYVPCRELGISFQKGDVLHVISQADPNWWQAYRDGEEGQALAGLIPSRSFQHQRETMKQTLAGENVHRERSKRGKFLCAKKQHKKKKKKVMYSSAVNDDFDAEQILTYEEVALYYPRANHKRPIVLIGPPNVGRHEMRQKLMEDTERFAAAIPHTSRARKEGEQDGVDYHFISRAQFEADILAGKFVEHGEYERNYYGTSVSAIRTVVNSGKICVLNLHPQSLKILKQSDLKPYVVFVAPPSLEKFRQIRLKMGGPVKDDELKDIIEKAREMEENFGQFFDMVIVNSDFERAFTELVREINILEREPQWVPAAWLSNTP